MDQLELLTNDELRIRLLEYGFPNLPVTQTTRKVLMKKLRNAVDGQKTKSRRDTIAVTKISSDEDTDGADDSKSKKPVSRRFTVNVEKITSTSNGKPIKSTESVTRRASGRVTPLANEKPSIVTSTAPIFSHIQEDTDEEMLEVIQKSSKRSNSKAGTPTNLVKSDMVRTSYKNADVVTILDNEKIPEYEDQDEEEYEDIIPISTMKVTKIPALPSKKSVKEDYSRRQTLSTTTYNASIPPTSAFREPASYRQSAGFGTPERTLTTSYNSGNYLSNRFQSNKENNNVDLDVNSSPYLSSFAKRLSTLQAAPLDAGMDKYRKMQEVAPPKSAGYRPSSSYQINSKKMVMSQPQKSTSLGGSFIQMLEAFDRQYNVKTCLYVALIILVGIGIIVILTH